MRRLLRLPALNVPLPLAIPSCTWRHSCAARLPHEPISSCLRQLHSPPRHNNPSGSAECSNYKLPIFPTKPLGLVEFIGFDGKPYISRRLPRGMKEDTANWRRQNFQDEEMAKETMKHPSFQPLVRVVNEVAELELAGSLLDSIRNQGPEYLDTVGVSFLSGGYHYIDKISGEYLLSKSSHDHERVTITFGTPEFNTVLKGRVWDCCKSYGHKVNHKTLVGHAQFDHRDATEAELDQVVCTSPYFKLDHEHHGEFQPAGSAR